MALFSKAATPFKLLHKATLGGSKKFSTCPKCAYNTDAAVQPVSLPGGINPELLLDSSPTPQLLLSESNIVVYANKSAVRLLRVVRDEEPSPDAAEGNDDDPDDVDLKKIERSDTLPRLKRMSIGGTSQTEAETKEDNEGKDGGHKHKDALRGRTLDQLNLDIPDEDMRRWITLLQVFESIKIHLARRQAKMDGKDTHDAELYGEGPKYNSYDYYREMERKAKQNGFEPDTVLRDTCTVAIEREDGTYDLAIMYISLIDPYSTGYSYSSISLVPTGPDQDARFAAVPEKKRIRKRDRIKKRISHYRESLEQRLTPDHSPIFTPSDEYTTGNSGEDLITRVARIKDLILDEMDYCFIALSPDGDIVITNKATKMVLGQETLKASMGEGFEWIARLDIWRPDFSERLPFEEWALNHLITHHKPLTQVIGLRLGEAKLVVELRGKCIWENSEKEEGLLAALAIVVDQTAWFDKEKNMQVTQLKQGYFLSNISRALKTPVSGIVGLLELLYGDGKSLSEDQRDWVRQIFASVNQLLLVVNDIIDFNRIEGGDIKVSRNTFILQDLIQELEILFSGSMAHKGVTFEVDTANVVTSAFGDGSRLVLVGDDEKIKRSAINLLTNAFKYTREGRVTLTISTMALQRNVVDLKFEIKDTGAGISQEDLKKLFVPLDEMTPEGAKNIAAATSGGTGIGLSIAQKFISKLGGTMGCDSTVDVGSTFWFIVPCGRPPLDPAPVLGPVKQTLSTTMGLVISSHELERDPDMPPEIKQAKVIIEGTLVLLVEDNWATQVVMVKRLARLGCDVKIAVNGQSALNILRKPGAEIDVIFMALQMSLLDGFEATKRIRTDPSLKKWRQIPIIGVTATEIAGDREKAIEVGLDEYVLKPLADEDLEGIIERVMDPVALGVRRRSASSTTSARQSSSHEQ